jgi:hypothetical protein
MGITLAVKRSYRHFLPTPWKSPKKYVRQWYPVWFFYTVGLFTGMYIHVPDPMRVSYCFLAVMLVLGLAKWWARASAKPPEV